MDLDGAWPSRSTATEWRHTTFLVFAVCAVAIIVRLVYVWQPLRSDEGGYLFVARHWDPRAGEFLYGDYHVDRPPLLLAIYRVAALWEWDRAIRILTIPFVIAAVIALARAGYLAAGWRAARWSALVAGALLSSPALAADQANGELFAVPLVAVSVAMTLQAWQSRTATRQFRWAFAAGAFATAAVLVKQSFLEGLVFAGVFVAAEAIQQRRMSPLCVVLALGFAAGTMLPNVVAYAWIVSNDLDPLRAWSEVVTFRGDALMVIWTGKLEAPMIRAGTLLVLAFVSAIVPLAWTWLRALPDHPAQWLPLQWAVSGMMLYGVLAIAAGGSYWPHYLLQLTAPLALATGTVAVTERRSGHLIRRWARASAGSSLIACAAGAVVYLSVPHAWSHERTGEWLADSAALGDTAFVAYGHPSVLEAADMSTPYPYLWSLPMRTFDPTQSRLRKTLAGPNAPTWIVRMNDLNSWDIDSERALRDLVDSRYREVAEVCGHAIHLRTELVRDVAPSPPC